MVIIHRIDILKNIAFLKLVRFLKIVLFLKIEHLVSSVNYRINPGISWIKN